MASPSTLKAALPEYFAIAYNGAGAGTYPSTLTITYNSIAYSYPLTLVVNPPDYSLASTPSPLQIATGGTQSLQIAATLNADWTPTNEGSLYPSFQFSLSDLPTGVSVISSTPPGAGQLTGSFELSVAPGTPPGDYTLTLISTGIINNPLTLPGAAPTHVLQIPLVITR